MTEKTPPTPENICKLFIGRKFVMDYVNVALRQADRVDKIIIVARGNNIPAAVSVAEVLKRKLNKEATVTIGSVEMENKFKKTVYVSEMTIEISITA
jgi:DNA-binding protein Alba